MTGAIMLRRFETGREQTLLARSTRLSICAGLLCLCLPLLAPPLSHSQAVMVDRNGNVTTNQQEVLMTVDRRYAPIKPTSVQLSKNRLDSRGRQALIRYLQSEQGFAMRPFPRGHKGLTLHANGRMDQEGESYVKMVTDHGVSANPGDRVVITDIKIKDDEIVLQLNGGPDKKHRFLSHIQLGAGPMMRPVVQDNGQEPVGSRITLRFQHFVPEVTGKQVEALLAPLISFGVKSPVQAFTDTLPAPLREAILNHRVLVGMSTDMVLFAKGRPRDKIREMDGQMPFEEWIYGKPPQTVEFVRINGNRVIRVEIAEIGKKPKIFTEDVVDPLMQTQVRRGSPSGQPNTHTIQLGDVIRNPNTQAPAPPPSLRKPGEAAPTYNRVDMQRKNAGEMKPVHFPKPNPEPPRAHSQDEQATPDNAAKPGADAKPSSDTNPAVPTADQAQPAQPPAASDGDSEPQ